MKKIYCLFFVFTFLSCKEKNTVYYLESGHNSGNKYFEMIHTDLDCSNINGIIHTIDKPGMNIGFCSKCVSEKEIRKYEILSESNNLTEKTNKAFEAIYELSRWYYSGDTLSKSKFIDIAMIKNKSNIERVYEYFNENARPKEVSYDIYNNSKYLLDMNKETFLIRIERYAESYLEEGKIFIWSEDTEKNLDATYKKAERFKEENGL